MRKQVLVAVGIVVLAGTALARADEAGEPRREGLRRRLELTDEQSAAIGRLRGDARKAAIRRRADMQVAREELRALVLAPELDEKGVAAKTKELSALQAAAVQARTDEMLAMRRLLTPEQVARLAQLPPRRHGPRERRREPLTPPDAE